MRVSLGLPAVATALLALCGCAGARPSAPSCVPAALNASQALAGGQVTVSPVPGSRDSSASTQISFLGAPASELGQISVVGSRSGSHTGSLLAYSQGDGASFVPTRHFSEGELVSVRAVLSENGQNTPLSFSFTVAIADSAHVAGAGTPVAPVNPREYQHFLSRPDLRPPTVTVTAQSPAEQSGELFLAPYSGSGQYGPMILDEHGNLLWFDALPGRTRAADLRVQSYEGRPVLSWWQDPLVAGGQSSAGVVIDNSAYQQIQIVRGGNGYQPDLHEFQITPQGTAFITVYDAIDCELSSVGGPRNGAVVDTLAQEIDLKTGLVMYEWHSLDHVALADSYSSARPTSRTTPFDYFHINSIDLAKDGSLLIDARDTWALYDVNSATGQTIWTLGGKHSSFAMGPGTKIAFQHDARQQPDGTISFFDNGASPKVHPQSRAIVLSLDTKAMTAKLVRRYEHPTPLIAGSQGDMQALGGGGWMVGWGEVPYFSQFSSSGRLLFDAHLPAGYESYRTYQFPWSAQPSTPPALVLGNGAHGTLSAYASWNGATQVASWRVLGGSTETNLKPITEVPRKGFETAIAVPASPAYLAVAALNSSGTVISSSHVVALAKAAKSP